MIQQKSKIFEHHFQPGGKMIDLSQKTISELFYDQIKRVTRESSFDIQYSEWWAK
ncbi:hypothetical protein HN592_06015 [Candidatus Woesearchaeota archaeon]|jgi:hypothetical protein|nr:hypothetical protein [Candidatus Woesearchaeota archaeon]MBT4367855.1 hypothetical protein [Candidatus Woesearchaeota archaeon]MBT4712343.1 hypothetical protein [Candidatus Woesearchaeota archaeon]MBT6639255.1 hypothetical protein [Candidatus Woesearchaeota archaeon]MBT7133428.1 hypothetical protein [Candidatus Woesearchaeota archaeon]